MLIGMFVDTSDLGISITAFVFFAAFAGFATWGVVRGAKRLRRA
jgi:hypothetical protein